jgi:polysaccharide export outer membrane protein
MKHRSIIGCILFGLIGAAGLWAQAAQEPTAQQVQAAIQAQTASSAADGPTLKPNPLALLRKFEPAADEEYRLGRGDLITIDFSGRPEMQAKLAIGPDGRISLPLAGEIMLDGLTRAEAAQTIQTTLSKFYSNLEVQVAVTQYTANKILVLGAVEHPGTILFEGAPTLLEALTRAGMQTMGVNNPQRYVPERCAVYRGSNEVAWVQLRELLETGNTLADIRLRRGDIVYVPNMSEQFVSILGEVQHPGAIPLHYNSSLASVLAEAGGFTDHAGAKPHIQIVDPKLGKSRDVTLSSLLNPAKSLEVTLHPGEIIYVHQSGFYHATFFLERLNPLIQIASWAFYAGVL